MAAGATATLTISASVTDCTPIVNTARIAVTSPPDPNPANDTASVAVTPLNADLQLTKTVDNDHPSVGQAATFTVTLTNAGPDPANEVVVSDLLPAGLSLLAATPSLGNYSSGTWTVGTLPAGASASLALQVAADAAGTYTNLAFVSDTATADCNPGNESAQSTITVPTPPTPTPVDLSILKTVSNSRPNAGDSITFTLSVTNPAAIPVDRVAVQDLVPAGLLIDRVIVSQGTVNPRFRVWLVGTVAANSTAILTIVGRGRLQPDR